MPAAAVRGRNRDLVDVELDRPRVGMPVHDRRDLADDLAVRDRDDEVVERASPGTRQGSPVDG